MYSTSSDSVLDSAQMSAAEDARWHELGPTHQARGERRKKHPRVPKARTIDREIDFW